MNNDLQSLTRLHLKTFGLSEYLIKDVIKRVKYVKITSGVHAYNSSDVIASIHAKLLQPKTRPKTRKDLERVLALLKGESIAFLRLMRYSIF